MTFKYASTNWTITNLGAVPYWTEVEVEPKENDPWELVSLMAGTKDITKTHRFVLRGEGTVYVYAIFQNKNVPTFKVTVTKNWYEKIDIPGYTKAALEKVSKDTELTVAVTPGYGYKLKSLKAGDEDITATKKFTVTKDTEVKAVFEKETFAVTTSVNNEAWGSIELTGASDLKAVPYCTELTVKVTEKEGCKLKEILVNGKKLDGTTFIVTEATTVTAAFEKKTFAVTTNVNNEKWGAIELTGASDLKAVAYGTELTVKVTEKEGCKLKEILVNGEKFDGTTFIVTKATTVTAAFEKKTFAVTTNVNNKAWGAIRLTGAYDLKAVPYGTELDVIVTRRRVGYNLKEILVNGKKLDGTTFIVTKATTVTAVFEKQTFAVTSSVNNEAWGSIELTGASDLKAVPYGTEVTVTVTPEEGYKLKSLKAGDEYITATKEFIVKAATEVKAVFEKETFAVTTNVNNEGCSSIELTGASDLKAVPYGTELTVTVTPEKGYKLKSLTAGDEDITNTKQFTVKAATEVKAVFERETFKITPKVTGEGCSLTFKNADTDATITDLGAVPFRTVVRVVPVENDPWELVSLMVEDEDITAIKMFVLKSEVTVYAVFQNKTVPTFRVTVTQTEGGTIAISGHTKEALEWVSKDTELTVAVTEKEGYKLKSLKAGDEDITETKKFTVTKDTEVKAVFEKETFKLHENIVGTGALNFTDGLGQPLDPAAVPYGTTVKVVPVENIPWELVSLMIGDEDITTTQSFVLKSEVTVYAVFQDKTVSTFRVTVTQTEGGTIAILGYTTEALKKVSEDTELTVAVTPDTEHGYKLKSLKAGEEDITETKKFTVTKDTEVKAVFELLTFQITPDVMGEGCSLTFKNAATDATITDLGAVPYGTNVKVVSVPKEGWELKSLSANGKDIFAAKEFTIKEATKVKAVFKKPLPTFKVTLAAAEHGKIAIEGHGTESSITVAQGTILTVTVTPEEGYKLKELKAGDEDITNTKQFTVKAATEVKAVFEKGTFVVKTSVNDEKGGEIELTGASNLKAVEYGTELTVTVTENKGYELKELKANDEDIIANKKFIVKAATEVKAVFESKQGGAVEDALLAGIAVAPNPFASQLRILNPESVAARYELVNASGMVVRSGTLSEKEVVVNTEALPAGIYFVRVEAQNGARKSIAVSK